MGAATVLMMSGKNFRIFRRFSGMEWIEEDLKELAECDPNARTIQLLLAMAAVYMAWAYKEVADGVKKERLSFGEAYKRLLIFLLVEKTFDIVCLDQILCMSTDYYQRCYPETKGCSGWRNRSWNNKNQAARLVLYPVLCAAQAYILTRNRGNGRETEIKKAVSGDEA